MLVIEMEGRIAELQKDVVLGASALANLQKSVELALVGVKLADSQVFLHARNLIHIKSVADVVNLAEYVSTRNNMLEAKLEMARLKNLSNQKQSEYTILAEKVRARYMEIEELKKQISLSSTVLVFPSRGD